MHLHLRGLATLVVVERPKTCQDSHLTGKPGASQGSPLRVAQGVPLGMGGDPRTVHTDAVSSSSIARPLYLVLLRGRDESPVFGSGHSPTTLCLSSAVSHRVFWSWWSPEKPPHRLRRITVCLLRLLRRADRPVSCLGVGCGTQKPGR